MLKFQPLLFSGVVAVLLALSVFLFFAGMQGLVFSLEDSKNSWVVIALLGGWLFACMFFAIYSSERCIRSLKVHLNEA